MNAPLDSRLIDRLIDGELASDDRRAMLLKLDSTPGGWRQCALAFLEAQEFSLAARSLTIEHASNPDRPVTVAAKPTKTKPPRRWGVAASILAFGFLAGFVVRGRPTLEGPTGRTGQVATTTQSPPPHENRSRPSPDLASVNPPPTLIPDYVRSQWERQGYRIEQKRKAILVDLDDGGRVTIPFDDVEFRFVGQPTY